MKHLLILLVLFVSTSFSGVYGDDFSPQSEFNRGNFQLEERNYDDAIAIYKQVLDAGFESGPLFLNLGLAHTYLEEFGFALFYFHKAAAFSQTREQAENGIEYVNDVLLQRHTPIPVLATFELQRWFFTRVNPQNFYIWAIVLLNIAAFALAFGFLKNQFLRIGIYAAIILLVVSITTAITGNYISKHYEFVDYGMITQHNLRVYETADLTGEPIFQLYQGYTFLIDNRNSSEDDTGVYVLMSNGIEGWIPRNGFMLF